MRYAQSEHLLRLARHLAATRTGLTLDETAKELEVGRRTAERLRDSLISVFPQMECAEDAEWVRRRRFAEYSPRRRGPGSRGESHLRSGDNSCARKIPRVSIKPLEGD
jgi:hypothetical protein